MKQSLRKEDWDLLLERIETKECTPFLGAGICYGILPLGKDIAQKWAEDSGFPLRDSSHNLAQVAQYLAIEYDPMYPKTKIREQFKTVKSPNFDEVDEPHRILADLELPVYITTNYDNFMLQALEKKGKDPKRALCRWNKFIKEEWSIFDSDPGFNPSSANPVVFHLHGYYEMPQSLVLTEDDYLDFLVNVSSNQDILPSRIREAWAGTSLLFLGYRLADWDFRVLFRSIIGYLERSIGLAHISVQLVPGEGEISEKEKKKAQDYLNKYFYNLKIRVYWGTCREFSTELKKRWEKFRNGK